MTTIKGRRVTIFLNQALVKQAKAQAVIQELTLTELVEKSLILYLPKETVIKKVKSQFKTI